MKHKCLAVVSGGLPDEASRFSQSQFSQSQFSQSQFSQSQGDAKKVVWAFDVPPSQRPFTAGANAVTPLQGGQIEALYGPRYRNSWVVMFERSGWGAPPDDAALGVSHTVLERVYFLVGSDIPDRAALVDVFRRVDGAPDVSDAVPRTPYMLWHVVDRDTLWRAGVVPISEAQVPTSKKVINGGDANQAI